jgi:hypothetical protein
MIALPRPTEILEMLMRSIACLWLFLSLAGSLRAETVTCPDIKDTWLSSCGKEGETNMGKAPKIKLKGYQEYGLLDFDVAALGGKKILSAALYVSQVSPPAEFAKERGSELRWFTVSTVSSDWEEGAGTNYTIDGDANGATFNEASFEKHSWSYRGSKNWDVTLGNGNTLRCDVDGGNPKDGWFAIPIDKRIVEAMVVKASYGMLLMDGSVFTASNTLISSREGPKAPFLKVEVEDAAGPVAGPKAPEGLSVTPAPIDANTDTGAIQIALTVPANAFAYDVKLDGNAVQRWQIPFAAAAGSKQSFIVQYVQPQKDVNVEVAAVDVLGNRSESAAAQGKTSTQITVPKMPASHWYGPENREVVIPDLGKLAVWAFPENSKLDPLSGNIVQEKNMDAANYRNSIWDAAAQTVRIPAARGEIAGFQLALVSSDPAAAPVDVSWKVEGLGNIQVRAFREWFVNLSNAKGVKSNPWQPDYMIPMKDGEPLKFPSPDNKVPNQKAAVLALDLIIPADTPPGEKNGTITLNIPNAQKQLTLKIVVYDAVIPAELNFIPELNCYGGPLGDAGTDKFFDAFRVAHYYRCVINRVPHHHNGPTDKDWSADVAPDGHVTDWTRFDKNLGPLLDGSAFKDLPRAGVPVPLLYLPFNESYPLSIKDHYKPGDNVPLAGAKWKETHDMLAKAPEDSFDQAYKDAFATCVKDYVKHFEEKGWSRTLMEGFNNNKVQYGKVDEIVDGKPVLDKDGKHKKVAGMTGTAWTLDEPQQWLDWQALLFYSKLFHKGLSDAKTVKFVFRSDVSRPMWQGNCMDGYMEVMVAGGAQFSMLPLMQNYVRRTGGKLFDYGGCNTQDKANHNTTAWVLKSYVHGCDGALPWQSIGKDNAFEKGDFIGQDGAADNGNMLIIDGAGRVGVNAVASMRLQSFRSGAQIAELLRLLEKKNNWSRTHSAALVSQRLPLGAQFKQAFADDAAALSFDDSNGDVFVQIKEGVLKLLTK